MDKSKTKGIDEDSLKALQENLPFWNSLDVTKRELLAGATARF